MFNSFKKSAAPPFLRVSQCPSEEAWQAFSGGRPEEEFYTDMARGLPDGTQITVSFNNTPLPASLQWDYKSPARNNSFAFWRSFKKTDDDKKIIYASHLDDGVGGKLQGKGIWTNINAKCFQLYKMLGISEVKVTAAEVGTYADALIGFHPEPEDWKSFSGRILDRLEFAQSYLTDRFGKIPHPSIDNIHDATRSDDTRSLWRIVDDKTPYAGMTVGKLMTIRKDFMSLDAQAVIDMEKPSPFMETPFDSGCWKGRLDMNDPETISRYTRYFDMPKPSALQTGVKRAQGYNIT